MQNESEVAKAKNMFKAHYLFEFLKFCYYWCRPVIWLKSKFLHRKTDEPQSKDQIRIIEDTDILIKTATDVDENHTDDLK